MVPATTIRLNVDISIGVRLLNSSVRAWKDIRVMAERERKERIKINEKTLLD